jgi:hypothetical protein
MLNLTKAELEAVAAEIVRRGMGKKHNGKFKVGYGINYLKNVSKGKIPVSRNLAPVIAETTGRFTVMELLYRKDRVA